MKTSPPRRRAPRTPLGLLALAALSLALAGCGQTAPPAPPAPTVARVEVSPAGALLTAAGATKQFTARALDAQGRPLDVPVTWSSTDAADVRVDASGAATAAAAVGSAQVVAEAGGVRGRATVTVARPADGAVLVADAQVEGRPEPVDAAASGVGSLVRVRLNGVTAPPVGTVVLASEGKPVAGKVAAVEGAAVLLELRPLPELFRDFRLDETYELTPADAVPEPGASQQGSGGLRPQAAGAEWSKAFGPMTCKASAVPSFSATLSTYKLSAAPNPTVRIDIRDGKLHAAKFALDSEVSLTLSLGLTLQAVFTGTIDCRAKLWSIPLPVAGPASAVVAPAIPVGFAVTLDGKLKMNLFEARVEGKVGARLKAGIEYANGAWSSESGVEPINSLKPRFAMPDGGLFDPRVAASFSVNVLSGLDATLGAGLVSGGLIEVLAGPRLELDLGFAPYQALDTAYASSYMAKLQAKAGLGKQTAALVTFLGGAKPETAPFSAELVLGRSPLGTHSASRSNARPGQAVHFEVPLDPAYTEFPVYGHNVKEVQIWRQKLGSDFGKDDLPTLWKTIPVSQGQTSVSFDWTPTEADRGQHAFSAFVATQLLDVPLEVALDSNALVNVGEATVWTGTISAKASGGTSVRIPGASGTHTQSVNQSVTSTITGAEYDEEGEVLGLKVSSSGSSSTSYFYSGTRESVGVCGADTSAITERTTQTDQGALDGGGTTEGSLGVNLDADGRYTISWQSGGLPERGEFSSEFRYVDLCTSDGDGSYTNRSNTPLAGSFGFGEQLEGRVDPAHPNTLSGSKTYTFNSPTMGGPGPASDWITVTITWNLARVPG